MSIYLKILAPVVGIATLALMLFGFLAMGPTPARVATAFVLMFAGSLMISALAMIQALRMARFMDRFNRELSGVIRSRAAAERLAATDQLTGLPNRRGLFEFLDRLAAGPAGASGAAQIGVMHIDLDHFKTVNDTLGHDAGDFVLKQAARRMSAVIRDSDMLARLGGDEFLLILPEIAGQAALSTVAARIIGQFERAFVYDGTPCRVGASVGSLIGGRRGHLPDPRRLLINADLALCSAKAAGGNRHEIFTAALAGRDRARRDQADRICAALGEDAFQPWFHPVVDLSSGAHVAFEVEPRWHRVDGGAPAAADFIAAAEAHGLAEEIGLRTAGAAFRAAAAWSRAGLPPPVLHLGVTRSEILAPGIVDGIGRALDEAGYAPGKVAIAVPAQICDERGAALAVANLDRLRDLGMSVIAGDFGAGRANLAGLARLRPALVRCAGVLTDGCDAGADDADTTVLRAVIAAAGALGIAVMAGGVASAAQRELLRRLGLHLMQGPQIAPAMPADEAGAWLARVTDAPDGPASRASA